MPITHWGIPTTTFPAEVYEEIMDNHENVKELTGQRMTLSRPGKVLYNEVPVELVDRLGYTVVKIDI